MNHADHSINKNVAHEGEQNSGATQSVPGKKQPTFFELVVAPFLAPLASLKLTVGLLILSVFVIWVATLQQVEHDIWAVKAMHFPYLFVYIPLYTFCPPAWLPEARTWLTEQGWGIFLPSGFLVIVAMLVNLLAAHTIRFRLKAKGMGLLSGTLVTFLGLLICSAVVVLGQSNGLQVKPPMEFGAMWYVVLAAMFASGLVSGFFAFRFEKHRLLERVLAGSTGLVLCLLPMLLLYTGASIGESGMRILWQIAQCSAATLVLYGGLALLFQRKAGIVLLHAGLILLLGNEIWVTLTHQEQRLAGKEGETVSHAIDIRATELVLVKRTDGEDIVYNVPSTQLAASSQRSANEEAAWISIPETDLQVRCLEFFKNSDVAMVEGEPIATSGVGLRVAMSQAPPVSGIKMNEMDTASAYVQFRNKSGDDLGTFLATQFQDSTAPIFAVPNVVQNGEDQYALSLWFKRTYKPYDVTVQSIESMDYPGTEIPRWYSTEFRIVDHETGYDGVQKVWMNNPLRYRNETFYQSGYFRDPQTGVESTTLQVVLNRGWMIPYLCCAMVSIGLLAQFIPVMLGYMEKQQIQAIAKQKQLAGAEVKPSFIKNWMIPGIAAGVLGIIFIGWAYPKKPKVDNLNLKSLAMIPVSYKGRIQPLDSVARTTLRGTVGREEASTPEKSAMGSDKKYPAVIWLADTIFSDNTKHDYRIHRIYNRQLLDNLKLPHRSGFQYTADEIDRSISVLQRLNDDAQKKKEEQRDELDKAALDLGRSIAMTRMTLMALGKEDDRLGTPDDSALFLQVLAAAGTKSTSDLPGVIPGIAPMDPWLPLDAARAKLKLEDIAGDTNETDEVAVRLINYTLAEKMFDDPKMKAELKSLLPDSFSREDGIDLLSSRLSGLSPQEVSVFIQKLLGFDAQQFLGAVFKATHEILGDDTFTRTTPTQLAALEAWSKFEAAYRDGDQEKLDAAAAAYQKVLREDENVSAGLATVNSEYTLSGWAPFYTASVICLVVSLMSFPSLLGMPKLRRTSFLMLLLALGLITLGMYFRIYISGRAPVTSLYSSALGIAWGCVLGFAILESVTRRGIGNLLGGFAGFAILLTAYNLSLNDDKFSVLRAVLDTQFWLWTHVTCVALGYVLTIVAGLWSCVMFYSAVVSNRSDVKQAADLTYGIICAATILSFVGTVLGGLWADDSWGRFWGWDPKENGAAMIVLWNAAVLHARWSGLIRYRGLMIMAIIGNMITLWSWFAVNELGIGLHSYGFTDGVITTLTIVWLIHLALIGVAMVPVKNMAAKLA